MRRRNTFGLLIGAALIAELATTPAPAPPLHPYRGPRDAQGHDVDRELTPERRRSLDALENEFAPRPPLARSLAPRGQFWQQEQGE
jgi:hypothetical protein